MKKYLTFMLFLLILSCDKEPPSPPENLLAHRGFVSIRLTWDDVADNESEYIVSYKNMQQQHLFGEVRLGSGAEEWTHGGLEPGSTYKYTVSAINKNGSASDSVMQKTKGAYIAKWNKSMDYAPVYDYSVNNGFAVRYTLTIRQGDSVFVAYDGPDTTCSIRTHGNFCATVNAYDSSENKSANSDKLCIE